MNKLVQINQFYQRGLNDMNNYNRNLLEAAHLAAVRNHQSAVAEGIIKKHTWHQADVKFCEERYPKDKDRKGFYSAVEHWDGVHIVLNEDNEDEYIFNTEFASLYDANFTIDLHELPRKPKPKVEEAEVNEWF